jgi:hypothetical protein
VQAAFTESDAEEAALGWLEALGYQAHRSRDYAAGFSCTSIAMA